jgi:hypothetical protein
VTLSRLLSYIGFLCTSTSGLLCPSPISQRSGFKGNPGLGPDQGGDPFHFFHFLSSQSSEENTVTSRTFPATECKNSSGEAEVVHAVAFSGWAGRIWVGTRPRKRPPLSRLPSVLALTGEEGSPSAQGHLLGTRLPSSSFSNQHHLHQVSHQFSAFYGLALLS